MAKPKPPPPGTEHWVEPGPFEHETERTAQLQTRPLPDGLAAEALGWSRSPAVLAVGSAHFDQAHFQALSSGDKRAYNKRFQQIAGAVSTRRWLWVRLADVLATTPEGRARLVELAEDASVAPMVREECVRALLGWDIGAQGPASPPDPGLLATLKPAFDNDGSAQSLGRFAAEAVLLGRGPDRAFEELAPRVELEAAPTTPSFFATQGVLFALLRVRSWETHAGWIELVTRAMLSPHHWPAALMAVAAGPNDPRIAAGVARYVEGAPAGYFHDAAWAVLHRSGDPAYAPHLARSLAWMSGQWKETLAFVRQAANRDAAPIVREWIAAVRTRPGWEEAVAEAESVLASLGDSAPVEATVREDVHCESVAEDQPMPPPLEDQRRELEARIDEVGLDREKVLALAQHAITIRATPVDDVPLGASRTGGSPDLPKGTRWPALGGFPLAFAAQIRLEDVAPYDLDRLLPPRGILAFFVFDAVLHDGPQEYGAGKVLYFEEPGELVRMSMPEPTRAQRERGYSRVFYPLCALRFATELQLPHVSHPSVRKAKLGAKYDELADPGPPRHQLLGYRNGYHESPAGTQLLLQLASDDPSGMEWGDVEDLSFTLPAKALAAGELAKAKARIGE
jgi:uncharacterized protein YwqG